MFLRIFRYRVQAELRDRHLALQARASRLYERYVTNPVGYFRRASDPSIWVELHRYADREECQKVAIEVAADPELARLWKDFQETLDPSYPPTLEEFSEYELPVSINASPFAQPPIDVKTTAAAAAAATVVAPSEVLEPLEPAAQAPAAVPEAPPAVILPAEAATQVAAPPKLTDVEPASEAEPIIMPAQAIEQPPPHLAESHVDETVSSIETGHNLAEERPGQIVEPEDDGGLTIYEEPSDESPPNSDHTTPASPAHDELPPATAQSDDSADIWVDRAADVELTIEDDSEELTIEQGPPEDEPSAGDEHAHRESHEEQSHGEQDHPEHGNGEHRQHNANHDAPRTRPLTFNDGVWQIDPPQEN